MPKKKKKSPLKKKRAPAKKKLIKKMVAKKKIVRKAAKRVAKKGAAKARKAAKKEKIIGVVTHYFPKVRAAVIKLKVPLALGDTVKIKGHTTEFLQDVTSMQLDHVPIDVAKKGQEIGLLVDSRVRQHDMVYQA